jgi:hypothetical protein
MSPSPVVTFVANRASYIETKETVMLSTLFLLLMAVIALFSFGLALRALLRAALERERRRRTALLADCSLLRPRWEDWSRSSGCGQIIIAAVGSYAARRLPAILETFVARGPVDHIGPILLLEFDRDVRQQCLQAIPSIFRSRVIEIDSSLLPAGMLGDTIADALRARPLWENELAGAARAWFSHIDREARPAMLLALLSPGGHAALGLPVLHSFARRFPRVPIYTTTILDGKRVVRQRFPEVRAYLSRAGLIRGTILLDNSRASERNDLGISVLFGGMAAAAWVAARPTELWNALAYVFPRERNGSLATISVVAETLPVYYLPAYGSLPEVYYTRSDLIEEKICRAVQNLVEQPALQSVPLTADGPGRARIIYVLAPLRPDPDLRELAQRIERALDPWRVQHDVDLLVYVASTGVPLHPAATEAPLVAVLLQPLADDGTGVDALALGGRIDTCFVTVDPSQVPLRLPLDEGASTPINTVAHQAM